MSESVSDPVDEAEAQPAGPTVFATVAGLFRYPVKGLSPEQLDLVELVAGGHFPGDRLFAIENGASGFDPEAPQHQPKIKFLMLMRNERLATLDTLYDDETHTLTMRHPDEDDVVADLRTEAGRAAVEAFFIRFVRYELRGSPRVLTAPDGFRFVDSKQGFVSIINLASVRAIGELVGAEVDPLRFRANIYLDGMEPWEEFDLVGSTIRVGNHARLRVLARTDRCAATNVDPSTGKRDLTIPRTLMETYGHADCGVYAEIIEGGLLAEGDNAAIEI